MGSKNEVFKFRSVNNIVIAPAKTGKERSSNTAVIKTDQQKRGIFSIEKFLDRILMIVEMKLIAPIIDLTPAMWREKMVKSTEGPECEVTLDRGGYTVQPVPEPDPTSDLEISRIKDGGSNQNLILFIRGKAISGAPIIRGTSQFPNPPIKMGITMKKIMINA